MREKLTEKDIKDLRYQCRMGYVIPSMVFIIGTFISSAIYEINLNSKSNGLNTEMILLFGLGFIVLSFIIGYKMNHTYLADIRYNEKVIETKTIQKKESKRDYEAGSGTLYIGQEMKGFDSFSIVVENYRYRVDKNLFMYCNEGDEVLFNYAPLSRYLINIELTKKAMQ
ncbi:MAG: hypothetical protein HOA61_07550 [Bacteroidetes bacterium]|jgi:hypothetical protein|nr:hypothetical protein [Bacteroidota bacterium]MBT5989943.1 hypothetical protein [Bacteroidota bacterium]MBT6835884.1 hypothetical protein [Bacteroidota bacterium]MBT7827828.1 hypothetical protein [Bacteroidota bacterium]MBT7994554.1 hypothetical protein [Bacteroidota bacterium]